MEKHKKYLINSVVFLCLIMSLMTFVATFFHLPSRIDVNLDHLIAINRFCQRVLAFLILLVLYNLHKRKFSAWLLTVIAITGSFMLHIIHPSIFGYLLMAIQLYCLIILIGLHKKFRRPINKLSLKRVIIISIDSIKTIDITKIKRQRISSIISFARKLRRVSTSEVERWMISPVWFLTCHEYGSFCMCI